MENVLLVAYLLIVLALIAVILIQRSEGGGLGMGDLWERRDRKDSAGACRAGHQYADRRRKDFLLHN